MHTQSHSPLAAAGRRARSLTWRVRLAVLGVLAMLAAVVAPLISAGVAQAVGTPASSYSFSPNCPPAANCQTAKPVTIILTAKDATGNPIPFTDVNLSFSPAPATTPGKAAANNSTPGLTPAARSFRTAKDGTIRINYTPGDATTGSDVITATDPTTPAVTAQESFAYGLVQFTFRDNLDKNTIANVAEPGTIKPGDDAVCFLVKTKPATTVFLSVQSSAGYSGTFNIGPEETSGTQGNTCKDPKAASTQTVSADKKAVVSSSGPGGGYFYVIYKPASKPAAPAVQVQDPTQATDTLFVANAPDQANPSSKSSIAYSYFSYHYSFSPKPIAPAGSLPASSTVYVTLQLTDINGNAVKARAPAFLSFDPGSPSNGASAVVASPLDPAGAQGATLPSSATPFVCSTPTNFTQPYYTSEDDGTIVIAYTSGSSASANPDLLTVTNDCRAPSFKEQTGYSYGAPGYVFLPTPIAPAGSLGASTTKGVTLHAFDAGDPTGNSPSQAPVFLSLSGTGPAGAANGSANANDGSGQKTLSAIPQSFTPNAQGNVAINYNTPGTPPSTGTDTITAQNSASNPAVVQTDSYSFGVISYAFDPTPIAPGGTLGANQSKTVNVTAKDAGGNVIKNAAVFLSFKPAPGGGTASACGKTLSATPQSCNTDANSGILAVTYTTPGTLPKGGTDTMVAATDSGGSNGVTDGYTFASVKVAITPVPIAPVASLGANATVPIVVTVTNVDGSPAPGESAFLTFTPTSGGGKAITDSGLALGPNAQAVKANNDGKIGLTYQAPAGLPASGADVLQAADAVQFPGSVAVTRYAFSAPAGYWLVASDGGIFSYGGAAFKGSTGGTKLNKPILGMAATPDNLGYWLVASDGGIFAFGNAGFFGSQGGKPLNKPIVGMATTPSGRGYWMVASDGGIFSFGDAKFFGSTGSLKLNQPIVGMTPTPSGNGYWLVASDGGIFSFGDGPFFGSTGGTKLNKPIVGMATSPTGKGYWFVASDGGIFAFGDAKFFGSAGGSKLNQPIVGMAATATGKGYRLVASDGGIFSYGDAAFLGSTGGTKLNKPIVGMAGLNAA